MRLLALLLTLQPILAQDPDIAFRDDFDTVDAWAPNNPRAPAEIRAENGRLVLIDPPGGEVTGVRPSPATSAASTSTGSRGW